MKSKHAESKWTYTEIVNLISGVLRLDSEDMGVLALAAVIHGLRSRVEASEQRIEQLERLAGEYWGEALPRNN